jgi:hypothetical protein
MKGQIRHICVRATTLKGTSTLATALVALILTSKTTRRHFSVSHVAASQEVAKHGCKQSGAKSNDQEPEVHECLFVVCGAADLGLSALDLHEFIRAHLNIKFG